jgi:hypothetical protein
LLFTDVLAVTGVIRVRAVIVGWAGNSGYRSVGDTGAAVLQGTDELSSATPEKLL